MPIFKDQFDDENLFIPCICGHPEHQLQFSILTWNDAPPEMVIQPFLSSLPFHKRVWHGIKYIFGYKSKYGHFGEIQISKESAQEIKEYMERFV